MRRRTEQGRYFVTITAANQHTTDEIIIEVDGQVVHSIGIHETPTEIVAPGAYGPTTFNLRDGANGYGR